MLVAFRVRASVSRENHIAFLEACLADGSQEIVAIREGETAPGRPVDAVKEIARLKRRPKRASSVCYLVAPDLGSRLSGRFGQEIVAEPTRTEPRTELVHPMRYGGLVRAYIRISPVLASVATLSLNLSRDVIDAFSQAGIHNLDSIARMPVRELVKDLHFTRSILADLSLVLIEASAIAAEHTDGTSPYPETPLGPDTTEVEQRALRQISLRATRLPHALTERLEKIGYDTLSDVAETPVEIWREVYNLTPAQVASLNAEIHHTLIHLRGRPVAAQGPQDSLKAFLARHVLADLTGEVVIPDAVRADLPDLVGIDVYAVTPVLAETLDMLHEPTGTAEGRPVWYRCNTGPLDADPSLITLAKLCASTLSLGDAHGHDLAAAPRGTAH